MNSGEKSEEKDDGEDNKKTQLETKKKRIIVCAIILLCCAGALQGILVNGLINVVISTIEKRWILNLLFSSLAYEMINIHVIVDLVFVQQRRDSLPTVTTLHLFCFFCQSVISEDEEQDPSRSGLEQELPSWVSVLCSSLFHISPRNPSVATMK